MPRISFITSRKGGIHEPAVVTDAQVLTIASDSNRIASVGTTPYTYDASGNLVSDDVHVFSWDALDRLIEVKQEDEILATYGYDSQNRRIRKTVGDRIVHYHYDVNNLLIAKTQANGGTILREYIYLDGEPLALKEYESNPGLYYFLNDHLGTPQQLVSSGGEVVWQAAYLPFGKAQLLIEQVGNNIRFPGQYEDAETGLHYNYYRYYNPTTGRYLRADPWKGSINDSGTLLPYLYASNNPISFTDIKGLSTDCGYLWCHPWIPKIDKTKLFSERDTWLSGADLLCYYLVRERDYIREQTTPRSLCMKLKRNECEDACVFDKFEIVDGPTRTRCFWSLWREVDRFSAEPNSPYMGHVGPVTVCLPKGENFKGPIPNIFP